MTGETLPWGLLAIAAGLALLLPMFVTGVWSYLGHGAFGAGVLTAAALSAVWIGLVIVTAIEHRWHSLKLVVLAPLALFWPAVFAFLNWAFRNG